MGFDLFDRTIDEISIELHRLYEVDLVEIYCLCPTYLLNASLDFDDRFQLDVGYLESTPRLFGHNLTIIAIITCPTWGEETFVNQMTDRVFRKPILAVYLIKEYRALYKVKA